MAEPTKILGIFQGDIILRTAIIEAKRRLYADPSLVDTVFQSLAQDELTLQTYGEAEIEKARVWFLQQDIPVALSARNADLSIPCITIGLQESVEAEQTHGDVNYVTQEIQHGEWPALTKHFTPVSYSPSSGIMELPADAMSDVVVDPGMFVETRSGNRHPVVENLGDNEIAIDVGIVDDFTNAIIVGSKPPLVTTIESVCFKETYEIGVHALGEPINCIVLHSILKFLLLRYKEELLEARNFERTTLASSDLRRNMEFDNELVFSRYITCTGFCRQWWPKKTSEAITSVQAQLQIGDVVVSQVNSSVGVLPALQAATLSAVPIGAPGPADGDTWTTD